MKRLGFLKRKKVVFPLIGGVLLLAVILGILLQPADSADEDIIWREYQVERGDITASLTGGGTLNATGVHHSFDVELTIKQILVEPGQEVHAGDTLATYSKEAIQEKIDELNDSLEAAQRTLADARNNKTRDTLQKNLDSSQSGQSAQSTYEGQKRDLENSIQTQERKITQLQAQLATYEQELRQAAASQDGTVNSPALQQLKIQLIQLQQELARMENNNTQNNTQEEINALVRQRAPLYDQVNALNRQINEITQGVNRLTQLKRSLSQAEGQLANVRAQLEALQPDDEQYNEKYSNLIQSEANLQTQITNLQIEIDSLPDESAQLTELRRQKSELDQQITDINYQIQKVSDTAASAAAVKAKQDQISSVQDQINALSAKEERISSLNNQIQQTQESIEAAQYDLETQRLSLETLNSDYERQNSQAQQSQQIQNKLDALNTEGLDHAIQNAQDEVAHLRAELAQAKKLLEIPVLTAKVDGIVTKVNYMAGDTVPSGKSIVTIGDSGEKSVVIQVSQEDIGSIEVGQAVEMQFLASPDDTITGHVSDKSLLPTEGGDGVSYKVTIAFDEDHPELMEGMTCGVKFILRREANVLILSNKAISIRDGRQVVTVRLPDGTHEERDIVTGFSDGRVSEIVSGLSNGDIVVTAG